jgi:uncharacterized membrane protein
VDDLITARILHVLGVVVWIGGVGMVTTVVLPISRRLEPGDKGMRLFSAVERRFAWIARAMVLVVGLTGFYMVWRFDAWSRFAFQSFWWMHAMVALWAIFAVVLFVAEPFFLHRYFETRARESPDSTLRRVQRLHWVLLLASLITIAGAVAGSHGYAPFW